MRYLRIFAMFLFSFLIWQGHYSSQALSPKSILTNPEDIRDELLKQKIQKISDETNQSVQYSWLDFWTKYYEHYPLPTIQNIKQFYETIYLPSLQRAVESNTIPSSGICLDVSLAAFINFKKECKTIAQNIFGELKNLQEVTTNPEKISYTIRFTTSKGEHMEIKSYMFGLWEEDEEDSLMPYCFWHFASIIEITNLDTHDTRNYLLDPSTESPKLIPTLLRPIVPEDRIFDNTKIPANLLHPTLRYNKTKYPMSLPLRYPDRSPLISGPLTWDNIKQYFNFTKATYPKQLEKGGMFKEFQNIRPNFIIVLLISKKIKWFDSSKGEQLIPFTNFPEHAREIAISLGVTETEFQEWFNGLNKIIANAETYVKNGLIEQQVGDDPELKEFLFLKTKEFIYEQQNREVVKFKITPNQDFVIIIHGGKTKTITHEEWLSHTIEQSA